MIVSSTVRDMHYHDVCIARKVGSGWGYSVVRWCSVVRCMKFVFNEICFHPHYLHLLILRSPESWLRRRRVTLERSVERSGCLLTVLWKTAVCRRRTTCVTLFQWNNISFPRSMSSPSCWSSLYTNFVFDEHSQVTARQTLAPHGRSWEAPAYPLICCQYTW